MDYWGGGGGGGKGYVGAKYVVLCFYLNMKKQTTTIPPALIIGLFEI